MFAPDFRFTYTVQQGSKRWPLQVEILDTATAYVTIASSYMGSEYRNASTNIGFFLPVVVLQHLCPWLVEEKVGTDFLLYKQVKPRCHCAYCHSKCVSYLTSRNLCILSKFQRTFSQRTLSLFLWVTRRKISASGSGIGVLHGYMSAIPNNSRFQIMLLDSVGSQPRHTLHYIWANSLIV